MISRVLTPNQVVEYMLTRANPLACREAVGESAMAQGVDQFHISPAAILRPRVKELDHFDRAICRKSGPEKRDSKQEQQGAKCFDGVFRVGGGCYGLAGF